MTAPNWQPIDDHPQQWATPTWASCRIGSCQRHQQCMYHPCRRLTDLIPPKDNDHAE